VTILALVLWALVAASAAYYLTALLAALFFRPPRGASFAPPVSILKPVCGRDRDFYSCIRSHAVQDYSGDLELLFAARNAGDEAVADIRRLAEEFPNRRIELFFTDREYGPNDKVNALERLRRECRGEVLLIDDSDIRVGADYVRRVMGPLEDPGAGLVTCQFRGVPGRGLPSLLEALWIATDFQVSVLVARLLRVPFALGATLALRRRDLERIGGFGPLAGYLADDYRLGLAIRDLGLRIELSDQVVETVLLEDSWPASWRHRLRWGRTLRACRPGGYLGMAVTFTAPLSVAALAVEPSAWPLAVVALTARWAAGIFVAAGRLRDPKAGRYLWLMPFGDLVSLGVWIGSLFGSTVEWRGTRFRLTADGRIRPN